MAYIGKEPADSFISFAKQDFTTSATTSYTLDHPVANQNELALFINFVRQEPTTAYTASGTSLTLTSATSSSDDMYCVYLGKAVQTVNPPSGSVGSSQVAASIITGQTALGATPADTDELLISDAGTLKRVDYSYLKSVNTPTFRAKLTSDTSFTTGTKTLVTFTSEDFDTASAYDTSNGKFTVPSGQGGKYYIYSQLIINAASPDQLSYSSISLYKNGSQIREIHNNFSNNYIRRSGVNFVTVEDLSAGDYIQIYVYGDDSSGNPDMYNDSTNPNFFGAFKIIE